ncbi:hypothetical protein VPNG_08643 [Cytospora leucostoma]|uniref:F-box domain-containing protein n=1 Tax=Cytospora leucostoma TaxID=1230097 RepID=A0A423W392_9PEZI|nr:hypothetical protein VPNG_08643 [Cytospora leucostoma]
MYNFLCTIRDRPDLGRLVKAVFLDISDLADATHTNEQYSQLVQERILSLGLLGRYAHRMLERRAGRTIRRKYETLAQVIMAQLSGIETLHLEAFETSTDIFGVFDDLAGTRDKRTPPPRPTNVLWPQLKQCALFVPPKNRRPWPLESCKGLVSLAPQLSSFHTREFTFLQRDVAFLENLTQLHLKCSHVLRTGCLRQALRSIRSLEVFSLIWPWDCESHTNHPLTDAVQLLKSYHKDTLRRLQLGGAFPSQSPLEAPELRQFPALEELRIHGNCIPLVRDGEAPDELPLASILPASIRCLHIIFASSSHVPQLVSLANEFQLPHMVREHPHLREVTVMYHVRGDGDDLIDDDFLDDTDDSITNGDLNLLDSVFSQTDISFSAKALGNYDWDTEEF